MSLANLASLLAKEKAVKSTDALYKTMSAINQIQESDGFNQAQSMFDKLTNMGPVTSVIGGVVAQIQAESTTDVMNLTKEIITLSQDESVGSVMNGVSTILGQIIQNATALISLMNSFSGLITAIAGDGGQASQLFLTMIDFMMPFEDIVELLVYFIDKMAEHEFSVNSGDGAQTDDPQEQSFGQRLGQYLQDAIARGGWF